MEPKQYDQWMGPILKHLFGYRDPDPICRLSAIRWHDCR